MSIRELYHVRIISDKKVFVCSWALALSTVWAKAQLQALIITIQPDMILDRIRLNSRHCDDRKQSRETHDIASFHGV